MSVCKKAKPASVLSSCKLLERGKSIPITSLNSCQIRKKSVDEAVVTRYRELLAESEPPAIVVIQDQHGRHYIADGHHRAAAALEAGRTVIKADIHAGDIVAAKLIGLEANQHGLGLSLAEKKAALDELLDNTGVFFSDSTLARMVGLDRHTVERRRRERASGDFAGAVGRLRALKPPEERLLSTARGMARQVEKLGVELLVKTLELLQLQIREELLQRLPA